MPVVSLFLECGVLDCGRRAWVDLQVPGSDGEPMACLAFVAIERVDAHELAEWSAVGGFYFCPEHRAQAETRYARLAAQK